MATPGYTEVNACIAEVNRDAVSYLAGLHSFPNIMKLNVGRYSVRTLDNGLFGFVIVLSM